MRGLTRPKLAPNRSREIIGHYIRDRREVLGLTQQELLLVIGEDYRPTAVSAIETGTRSLPPQMWEKMAKALQVDSREFVQVMLRYTNPWAYGMLFGFTRELRTELNTIPRHYSKSARRNEGD